MWPSPATDLIAERGAGTCGDNSVSSCRSYSPAKGPGTKFSAGAVPMALSLSGEGPRAGVLWDPQTGCQGVLWDPQDPLS
jgi:hypothetical protein